MAFNWKDFLELAERLHHLEDTDLIKEACCRSVVSRAYYAAFCHARNYARDNRHFTPTYTEKDHREVREHFKESKTKGVASALDVLRQLRNKADYVDEIEDIATEASECLGEARNVFFWLK